MISIRISGKGKRVLIAALAVASSCLAGSCVWSADTDASGSDGASQESGNYAPAHPSGKRTGSQQRTKSGDNGQEQPKQPAASASDEQIKTGVLHAFSEEPALQGIDIGVEAAGGVVTLTGEVPAQPQKVTAYDAARLVSGVRKVANKIKIKKKPDAEKKKKGETAKTG